MQGKVATLLGSRHAPCPLKRVAASFTFVSAIASTRFMGRIQYSGSNVSTPTVPCIGSSIVSCVTLYLCILTSRFLMCTTATLKNSQSFLERVCIPWYECVRVRCLRMVPGIPYFRFLKRESCERGRDVSQAEFACMQQEALKNYLIDLICAVVSILTRPSTWPG